MATQDRKTTGTQPVEEEETGAVQSPAAEAEASAETEGVDDLLDEIDGVLESNAEEFVRGFIQKGGQ
ncbi:ubiquitin-like protein Pup [Arthrobacter yangruifuii]|uniref:Prokaryotic ubiquitin-like protein Pup n=1 Tax=Arthrobacter yangruifuii TaxID=2606616 RepID=A0A5N6MGU4_9MICC|nr:ubiquitin-like protein Pup [Arthrobacter yangruifuii]KAD3632807.1 ubiquitin-like protein Pup [Arthrobacter yangruifuii]